MHRMRADYGMTKPSRFKRDRSGFDPMGSGADYHIRSQSQYLKMIELARELEREDPYARQAVRRVVNAVQPGAATVDPQTGDKSINAILFDLWEEWSTDPLKCHAAGKMSWRKMTNVGFARTLVDGDYIGLPLTSGAIQTLEGHRLRSPDTGRSFRGVCGVESTNEGRPTRYWITKEPINPNERAKVSDVTSYPAFDSDGNPLVHHVYDDERFTQSRGITRFAGVYDVSGMRDDLQFANLVRAQVASCITYAEQWDVGSPAESGAPGDGPLSYDYWPDGTQRTTVDMVPGKILRGRPGQSWHILNPNIPGNEYECFVLNLLACFAVNLDIPLMVLLLDPTKTNFSGWRGAMNIARETYSELRQTHVRRWHAPVYQWKVRQWASENPKLAAFVAKDPGNLAKLLKHGWNFTGWENPDPVTDATVNRIEVGEGLTSHRRFSAKRHGVDWEVLQDEIIEDRFGARRKACLKARELNTEFPEFFTSPEMLCPMPQPMGITQSTTKSETKTETTEGDNGQPA
jgi:capsid protein